jgi:hypothetical protein
MKPSKKGKKEKKRKKPKESTRYSKFPRPRSLNASDRQRGNVKEP